MMKTTLLWVAGAFIVALVGYFGNTFAHWLFSEKIKPKWRLHFSWITHREFAKYKIVNNQSIRYDDLEPSGYRRKRYLMAIFPYLIRKIKKK